MLGRAFPDQSSTRTNSRCKCGLNGNQPWSCSPPPTRSGWRLCVLFHAVYSFEQIVSFTRHSKSVVANTCPRGECHLAHRGEGCKCNRWPHSPSPSGSHVKLTSCCTQSHLRKKLSPPQCPFHTPGPHTHSSAEVSQHLREGVVCLPRREGDRCAGRGDSPGP